MKLLKRKTATLQDYINLTGMILFIWVITAKKVMIGTFGEIFVMDNALILICLLVSIEMTIVNLSIFITDFKNWLYSRKIKIQRTKIRKVLF